jgi:CopG family nickel-responsive transcriptional regulator
MSGVVRFSVSIEDRLIRDFDELCRERGWSNRSEAIRDAIRRRLVEREWETGDEVAGVITLLYDHHRPGLAERLTEIQHHALDAVVSTTHVHVDARNCLEVVIVKGEARAIERLAHRMIGLKGVKHGELTGTSTGKRIR